MSNKVARSIRRGLTQALAYAKREAREADYRVHVPADTDMRAIREKLGKHNSRRDSRSVSTLCDIGSRASANRRAKLGRTFR